MKYIKLFENYDVPEHDMIGVKVGDIVVCTSSIIAIEEGKSYEILEILDHRNEGKKNNVEDPEDLISVKDIETDELFWSIKNDLFLSVDFSIMRKFYAWRFVPEFIYNVNKYNL
jgi:hypothetical protein